MFVAQKLLSRQISHSPALREFARCFLSTNKGENLSLIINAVGRDRLGLVSDISGFVINSGGNVGDSQAGKLGNYFSLTMLVYLPKGSLDPLREQLESMTDMKATVFEVSNEDSVAMHKTPAYAAYFTLEGADNPGIVHKVTSALASNGLSIDRLTTDQEIAPYGGSMLFKMRGIASAAEPLPASFDAEKIKRQLAELGDSLNCDFSMEEMEGTEVESRVYSG